MKKLKAGKVNEVENPVNSVNSEWEMTYETQPVTIKDKDTGYSAEWRIVMLRHKERKNKIRVEHQRFAEHLHAWQMMNSITCDVDLINDVLENVRPLEVAETKKGKKKSCLKPMKDKHPKVEPVETVRPKWKVPVSDEPEPVVPLWKQPHKPLWKK